MNPMNTAIFIDDVFLRALSLKEPARLVHISGEIKNPIQALRIE
jgi:hypothetical protein